MIFAVGGMKCPIRSVICFGIGLAILSWNSPALAEAGQPAEFQLSKHDAASAAKLAGQLASLSPRVDRVEAKLLADFAFITVSKLRREYRMFGTPIFNNFLIYNGLRKRGYCYQWSEDLLLALDQLHLKTLELRWGEHDPNTWRENNCLVVTAKGQPFNRGVMLECWRHLGHLYFSPVASDWEGYTENSSYAQFVRKKAAGLNVPGRNRRVAWSVLTKGKAGDQNPRLTRNH